LALFVALIRLDAAYDASPRDLRANWVPLVNLVVLSVAVTTAAVAVVVHALVPTIPWAAAIALGAIVAPPDATAATAILRHVKPPHRILTILEGESLLNDASALLIYRLALGALAASTFSIRTVAPTLLVVVAGSVLAGRVFAWLVLRRGLTVCVQMKKEEGPERGDVDDHQHDERRDHDLDLHSCTSPPARSSANPPWPSAAPTASASRICSDAISWLDAHAR